MRDFGGGYKTVLDVIRFKHQQRSDLVDYSDILDTVGGFDKHTNNEDLFREYLVDTYGIDTGGFRFEVKN